ncbi:hypothetical protein EDB86DRAFT_3077345 [Lactarius hatsudake]|nr:hypothetical protein EDB86DRAFT_3077345 [Lactarius hatsudake]
MDNGGVEDGNDGCEYTHASPTLHLPHLLRVLGPSSPTLYKHVLGRQWILIYTQRRSGVLPLLGSHGHVFRRPDDFRDPGRAQCLQLKGEHTDVLGIVTPHDIDMLEHESQTGCGWIARTTDAVSLEKPQYYDLIDLISYAPPSALDADTNGITRAHRASAPVWRGRKRGACTSVRRLREVLLWLMAQRQQRNWDKCRGPGPRANGPGAARVCYYDSSDEDEDGAVLVRSRQTRTTLALLQVFHGPTRSLLSPLATVLPSTAYSLPDAPADATQFSHASAWLA